MKSTLRAGSEIDFLSKDELQEVMQEVLSGFRRPSQTVRPIGGIALNASGNSAIGGSTVVRPVTVYECPAGYKFRLHRILFLPDGYTFGAPFGVGTTGYLNIVRSEHVQDGIGFSVAGLPQVWTAGSADGIEFTNGERVAIEVHGGPASVSLACIMQGTLAPYEALEQ